jgi:hypothetical protein
MPATFCTITPGEGFVKRFFSENARVERALQVAVG